jgi:CheY-like chemotaxis protein
MPATPLLIVARTESECDRYAEAFAHNALPFLFRLNADSAIASAISLQPALTLVALPGTRGADLCRRLRELPETRALRTLLVIERKHLAAARTAQANALVFQPAPSSVVAVEAQAVLSRVERRALWMPDRRNLPRGGRRITDISVH